MVSSIKYFWGVTLDQPCVYHSKEGFPCKHTTAECHSLKEIKKARRAKGNNGHNRRNDQNKGPDPTQEHNADPGFGRDAGALHTFISIDNRREKKVLARAVAVNAVAVDTTCYLNWSEQPIQWTREDHPPRVEYPGRCALIVRPKVADYWLSKTLMDGGSTINILYYDTFRRLGLPQLAVEASSCTFHGIVPGRKAYSLGKVALPVTFGMPANFRTEKIVFELVNFRSPYHCVLGR